MFDLSLEKIHRKSLKGDSNYQRDMHSSGKNLLVQTSLEHIMTG